MPSAFEAAWVARQGALFGGGGDPGADPDKGFGEPFELHPRTVPTLGAVRDVNARPVADASRPMIPFRGIFLTSGSDLHAIGRAMAEATTRVISAETPMVEVLLDDYAGAIPAQNDVVVRPGTAERFAVTAVERVPIRRAYVYLRELR